MDVIITTGRRIARKGRSALSALDPRLRDYFLERIGTPTSLQEEAWSKISDGSDVLLISPTGSGKTLAALAVPFDSILNGSSDRSSVHVLYITPMRALGHDMLKTLKGISDHIGPIPSRERKADRGRKGPDRSDPIAVEIRTGDVPQSLRRRMLVRPPDVLITTPENLLLMLCSSHRRILSKVRFAVVDEVHEMMRSKRGSMLSLSLEYLRSLVEEAGNGPLRTIGLSATASPREASRYIAGHGPDGRPRDISIISGVDDKELTIAIRSLPEMEGGEKDIADAVTADIDGVLDRTEGSVVVFRNTRSGAEETAHALMAHGRDDVAPHHGSLGSDLRSRAETGLRAGSLKCIVSSTSLELGIDVGSVGLCLQVSSPGDPTRLVQRFGRAGHGLGRPSEGIIYPLDAVDLLDSYAVSVAALRTSETSKGGIVKPYDVLAQFIVGLSLREGGTDQKEVLRIARRTSSFHGLRSSDVSAIIAILAGRMSGKEMPRPRIWLKDGALLPRKDTRQAFYLNSGTIPRETNYRVVEDGTRRMIGELSREFGSSLYEGDVILLGSRSFRIRGFSGAAVRVREDREAVPTIPRWSGEVPSRPRSVAAEVYRFWSDGTPAGPVRRIGSRSLTLDDRSKEILGSLRNEGVRDGWAPARSKVPIEELPRRRGGSIYVFHLPEGRSVTDPLARIVALGIRRSFGARADFVATDDGFAIASPAPLLAEDLRSFMDPDGLEDGLRDLLFTSSYFDRSFAQCAGRSLLVLSRFRGRETGAMYKRRSLEALSERIKARAPFGHTRPKPESGLMLIRDEAMRETIKDRLDISRVIGIASSIHAGERAITILPARKALGTVGQRIVGDWGVEIRPPASPYEGAVDGRSPVVAPVQPQRPGASPAEASSIHLSILSNAPDVPSGSDPGPIIAEAALQGLSPEDLATDGHLLAVRHPEGVRYFDPNGIPKGADPPSPERILAWRRRLLRSGSGMRAVTEHVPFFTHPIEIGSRATNLGYDDIRSAFLSGRIITFHAAGGLRVGDPRWALAWELLSPRSDATCGTDRRQRTGRSRHGHAIIPLEMEDMAGPTMGLTRCPVERTEQGDRSFEAVRRLLHVLNELGPMSISDLRRSFAWDDGPATIALRSLLADGTAKSGLGVADPTGSSQEPSIWFWSAEWELEHPDVRRDEGDRDDGWANSTDPYFLLFGRAFDPTTGPRVKGAKGLVFVNVRDGMEAGRAFVSQGGDLVRVHDIEVRDYMDVGRATGSLLRTLDAFSRLGYDLITVEGIMGVPAPEGASAALGALAQGGFSEPAGGERRLLARGFSRIVRIGRSEMIVSMLMHQGLLDGHHLSHPLEAILRNLSIADRWEVLSRVGSSRYGSISPELMKEAMGRVQTHMDDLCGSVATGEMPKVPSVSDLISADREPLPEGRDLMRKLDLELGMMEQSELVWSTRQVLRCFPPQDRSVRPSRSERDLVSYVRLGSDRSKEHPELSERSDEVDGLIRKGFLTVDAWGRHHILRDLGRSHIRERRSSDRPRGVLLRAFLLSSALSLGMFTFRDLVALSPGLGPHGRVRAMLSDLCRTHLERYVTDEPTIEAVYLVKGLDLDSIREGSQAIADEGPLTVISPKDRMARVLSGDFSARLGGVRGHLVLKGAEPAALIGFRRAPRTVTDGPDPRARGRLLISSMKRGHQWRADVLIRGVRKRMFELGFDTVSETDLERERSLYNGP